MPALHWQRPMLLAFNAVNNLFGVGSSSMMSRALGRKDYEMVRRGSAFGFYCALAFSLAFSLGYNDFQRSDVNDAGCDRGNHQRDRRVLDVDGQFRSSAGNSQRRDGVSCAVGRRGTARKHRHDERLYLKT